MGLTQSEEAARWLEVYPERRFRWLMSGNKRHSMVNAMRPWIKRIRGRVVNGMARIQPPPSDAEMKQHPVSSRLFRSCVLICRPPLDVRTLWGLRT